MPFHNSPEVAFPFSLPGTFVFPAPRNKTDTDATSLLGQCAIKTEPIVKRPLVNKGAVDQSNQGSIQG